MQRVDRLTERQARILNAIVQLYIETAEPASSQAVARRSRLGISSASVRNTMSELEELGFLFHTHASSGRVPTDGAYRAYVNGLMRPGPPSEEDQERIKSEVGVGGGGASINPNFDIPWHMNRKPATIRRREYV